MTEPNIVVTDASERSRFEVHFDGELAGFAEYRLRSDRIVFTHTEVDDRFQGHGLAGRLARHALDAARAAGLRVTPLCPYIAKWIGEHPEYVDLVDDAHRDLVSWRPPERS